METKDIPNLPLLANHHDFDHLKFDRFQQKRLLSRKGSVGREGKHWRTTRPNCEMYKHSQDKTVKLQRNIVIGATTWINLTDKCVIEKDISRHLPRDWLLQLKQAVASSHRRENRARTEAARLTLTATKPFSPLSKHCPSLSPRRMGVCFGPSENAPIRLYYVCPNLTSLGIFLARLRTIWVKQVPSSPMPSGTFFQLGGSFELMCAANLRECLSRLAAGAGEWQMMFSGRAASVTRLLVGKIEREARGKGECKGRERKQLDAVHQIY